MSTDKKATNGEKNQVLMEALELYPGETTYRKPCPRCKQAGSFSITRDEQQAQVLFKCFRASCGIEGAVRSTLYDGDGTGNIIQFSGQRTPDRTSRKFKANTFSGTITSLPDEVKKYLYKKFELENLDIEVNDIKYDPTHKRLVLPIYDLFTRRLGCCLKKLPDSSFTGPKTVNYWEIDDPIRLHFPPSIVEDSDVVVVTEGILDAIKVSSLLPSCALMGVGMSEEQAAFLASHFTHMILMLDSNATVSAQRIRGRYNTMFKDISIRFTKDDPKDTSYEQLERVLVV